jgi:hypothetical protein
MAVGRVGAQSETWVCDCVPCVFQTDMNPATGLTLILNCLRMSSVSSSFSSTSPFWSSYSSGMYRGGTVSKLLEPPSPPPPRDSMSSSLLWNTARNSE